MRNRYFIVYNKHDILLILSMFQVKKIVEDLQRNGVNVVKYMECSANSTNVLNVFDEATKIALEEENSFGKKTKKLYNFVRRELKI